MINAVHIFKALGDPTRLRLLAILAQGDFNVNELLEILRMGQSRISRHLKILADCGLLTNRREGNWIYYALATNGAETDLTRTLQLAVKGAAALPEHKGDLQQLESIVQRRRALSQKYFNRVGPEWERLQREVLDSGNYREQVLELLPHQQECAADLGAGAGLLLPELLQRFAQVIAIDSSPTMLKVAADYLAQQMPQQHGRCEFRLGELEHMPIADRLADAAVACMVLHHVSNPGGAIKEAYRILKKGGTLVIADLHQHEVAEMREQYADLWLGFKKADMSKWLRGAGFVLNKIDILNKSKNMKVLLVQAIKAN